MTSRDMMKVVLYIARVLLISFVFRPITTRYYGSSTLYSLYLIGDSATPSIYPTSRPAPCVDTPAQRGAPGRFFLVSPLLLPPRAQYLPCTLARCLKSWCVLVTFSCNTTPCYQHRETRGSLRTTINDKVLLLRTVCQPKVGW